MRRPERREDGFTLVELLMTVIMTAVIIGAIAAALTTALRNDQATADRLADSVDTQLLSTYLPGDVQNGGPNPGDFSNSSSATAGCTGLSGTNVLAVKWTDAETSVAYGVTYRTLAVGSEQRLMRFTCGGATPGASVVGRGLAPSGGATADLTGDPRIVFTLTSAKGYVSKLSAMRRTYAGGAVAPPPLPCLVDEATLSPPSGSNASGTLLPPVILTVKASGNCGTLQATYTPDPAAAPRIDTLGTGAGTMTKTLVTTGWTSGDRPLTLSSNGSFLADVPFAVVDAPPCAVTNVATSPGSGTRSSNPSPNTLTSAVTVTAEFSNTCLLSYSLVVSTDGGAPKTYSFPASGLTRPVTVPATVTWSDGTHALAVQQGATQVATGSFTVGAQTCAVGVPTVNPSSVNAMSGALKKPVTVSVTTTGVCDALSVRYTPATTSVIKALVANATFSVWSYTIPDNDPGWTTGQKTLEIVSPAGVPFTPPRTVVLGVT